MGKIEKFEDLEIWKRMRKLVSKVYRILEKFPKSEQFNLVDQAKRAVTSAPTNTAEGFGRYHPQESVYFYRNSRGSLSELKNIFYLSNALKYIESYELNEIADEINEISKMLNGLINSTEKYRPRK